MEHVSECIFCNIINGAVSADIVFDGGDTLFFKDIHPKAPVHLLVIPKVHIQSIAHLEDDHNDIIAKLVYTAKKVAQDQGLRGYKLLFNVGKEGGQVIDHLHLHILGGWNNIEDRKLIV